MQQMLIPEPVELSAEQAALLLEHRQRPGRAGAGRRGLRRRHDHRHALSRAAGPALAGGDSQARRRSFDEQGAGADARAAPERPHEPDGLPCRGALGRRADAGGNRRPGRACAHWPTTPTTARTADRRRCSSRGRNSIGSFAAFEVAAKKRKMRKRDRTGDFPFSAFCVFSRPPSKRSSKFRVKRVLSPTGFVRGTRPVEGTTLPLQVVGMSSSTQTALADWSALLPDVQLDVRQGGAAPPPIRSARSIS